MFPARRRSPGRPSRRTDPPRQGRASAAPLRSVGGAPHGTQARWFRAIIEHSPDGVALLDAERGLLYASPSTTRILGYAVTDLVRRDGLDLAHPDDRERLVAQWTELRERPGHVMSGSCRLHHTDGSWRWVDYVVSNLLGEPGVRAIVANYRDVTERRAAEEALRDARDLDVRVQARTAALKTVNELLEAEVAERQASEARLRTLSRIIEQTADSVVVTDRNGVIEYVNASFEELTGFSRDEALGARANLVKSGAHDDAFYERLWTSLLSGRPFRAVFTNRTKDGRLFHEDQTITPLRDRDGTITHFVSTGRDITGRKRIEEALRRLNEALEREATRIAGVLHDEAGQFLTSAHITLAEVARELPAPAREALQDVRRDLNEIEGRLRRLSHELHPRILDDLGLVDAIRFVADGVARRAAIPISVAASAERRCPPAVEVAVYRLVQEALTNMAKHARATRGTIVVGQEPQHIRCSIRDDGVGFDVAAVLGGRREPGLGLVGIQDRLEAVGGTLEIISAPGRGTELRATIPLE